MSGAVGNAGLSSRGVWGIVILGAAILVMAGIAAAPFLWRTGVDADLAEKRTELRFIEARLQAAKDTRRAKLTTVDAIEPMFVAGATPGLALAEMQSLIARLAADNGMAIERMQPLQTEREGGRAVLRMDVEAAGSIEGLRGYLLALETGQPLVFVNRIKIAGPAVADETSTALPSDKLTVALQLEAYGWWEAKP